jgi:hypothetical protein
MTVCLEIVRADGRIHREVLPEDRTTVGSSNQATICVPDAPELEPLHILVVPREKGVWLSSARNARTPTLLDGKPFESGQLPLGAEIDVGSITFRVVAVAPDNVLVAVLVMMAAPLLQRQRSDAMPRSNAPAPPLFEEASAEDCPAAEEAAEKRGARAAERARSKTLRYPFDAREGLRAVELYRAAAPCLTGSPMGPVVTAEEKRLRQRIEDDYQVQRLHLERALGEADWDAAMVASGQLLSLLADRPGPYRDWLARLRRFLDVKLSETKKDKNEPKPITQEGIL